MKGKVVKLLIVCVVILAVILLAMLIANRKTTFDYDSINNEEEYIMEAIPVQYLHKVMDVYEGDLDRNVINKTYYNFSLNIVPKYRKLDLDEEKAKNYFNKNSEDIIDELGIENEEDFSKFCKLINTLDTSNVEKLEPLEEFVYEDTIVKNKRKVNVYFGIKYNNGQEIVFNSVIKNYAHSGETAIIFNANVNEEISKQVVEKRKENEIVSDGSPRNDIPPRGVPLEWADE